MRYLSTPALSARFAFVILALALAAVSVACASEPGSTSAQVSDTGAPATAPAPTFEELQAAAFQLSYDDLFRNNEDHIGKTVWYTGQVIQVVEGDGNEYQLRVNVTKDNGFWDDTMFLRYTGPRLLEDDIIEFVGKVNGLVTYEAIMGNQVTIPDIAVIESRVVSGDASGPTPTPITITASRSTPEQGEPTAAQTNTDTTTRKITPPPTSAPATVTAVPMQTATAIPASTPRPTATPVPAPKLNLVKAGFGQSGDEVSFAFIVENPSADLEVLDTEYRVMYLDDSGLLLQSETGTFSQLLPGDREAVTSNHHPSAYPGTASVPSETVVDSVEIRLRPGTSEVVDVTAFSHNLGLVEDVSFQVLPPGEYDDFGTPLVSGTVRNPYAEDYADAVLAVVFYDADSNIVGGDVRAPFNFLPGESQAAFQMAWGGWDDFAEYFATVPTSAEVYLARFVALEPNETSTPAPKLNIAKAGFGQMGNEVSFAFIVENPSQQVAVSNSKYRVLYFDAADIMLQSETGSISSLLPGDREAITADHGGYPGTKGVPLGTLVDRVEFRLQPGTSEEVDMTAFSLNSGLVENVSFQVGPPEPFEDFGTPSVSGTIRNPYPEDYGNAVLAVVFYDADGNIVGGDVRSPLDFIPAESQVAFEITWTSWDDFAEHFATVPVSAEVYLERFVPLDE